MKKSLLLVSMFILLTSCSFFSKKERIPAAEPTEVQLERKTGIVNVPEVITTIPPQASFVLNTDTGEVIYIDSASVNLRRYKGRRVEAEGKLNDEKTIFLIENVTSLSSETAAKTLYLNPLLGIQFSYPQLWILKETKTSPGLPNIQITPFETELEELDATDHIIIERTENNKRLSAREWLGLDEQYRAPGSQEARFTYQQSFLGTGALEAVKKTVEGGKIIEFFVGRDTYMYRFSYSTISDSDASLYRNAFYDLVMSFEFIPFGATKPVVKPLPLSPPPEPTPPPSPAVTAPMPQASAGGSITFRNQLLAYVKSHISELAPEPASLGGAWHAERAEFTYPDGKPEEVSALYVVYSDGHDLRKILLAISPTLAPESMSRSAYFKPGETTDWMLVEGTDMAKSMEKSVVLLTSENSREVIVKKGFALLDAKSFKAKIQYPSNWYWQSSGGEYLLSDKPVTSSNVLVRLSRFDVSEKPNLEYRDEEKLTLCVQSDTFAYCVSGALSLEEMVRQIFGTFQAD